MLVKKGQLVATSSGMYSDYSLHDHFRVLRDFDSAEMEKRYRAKRGGLSFEGWMIREGAWEPTAPTEVLEWWIDEDYLSRPRGSGWDEPSPIGNDYYRAEAAKFASGS